MELLQITGTKTYADNIKTLKIGDIVKLTKNPKNKVSADAIGVYTMDNLKVGYVPFKDSQINIKKKYIVHKINLLFHPPLLLLSYELEKSNFIKIIPEHIDEQNNNLEINEDVKTFKKYLQNSGENIKNIGILYKDDNYINLLVNDNIFYTVSRKYYENNIFKYDEFFKYNLIPKNIYLPFQIHRLETYIKINYDFSLTKKFKNDKYNIEQLVKKNISSVINENILNNLSQDQIDIIIKLIVQYDIEQDEYYNPNKYYQIIMNDNLDLNCDLSEFKSNFNDLKIGGLCYNHDLKQYCYIDLYDDENIIEISTRKIDKEYYKELIIKLMISNKKNICVFNPILGLLYQIF